MKPAIVSTTIAGGIPLFFDCCVSVWSPDSLSGLVVEPLFDDPEQHSRVDSPVEIPSLMKKWQVHTGQRAWRSVNSAS
jgi:hypothetical protein